jgi:hypothetical protein
LHELRGWVVQRGGGLRERRRLPAGEVLREGEASVKKKVSLTNFLVAV